MQAETNTIPQRPTKVTLALYMLYISLGISLMTVLVTWLRSGFPGPPGYWLINVIMMILMFHFQAPAWGGNWAMYGGLLIVAILPIAVWLYYMIGKGKNWARITLLVFVILEVFDFLLGMVVGLSLPMPGGSSLSMSDFLINPTNLQIVVRMIAVTLLFGGASSNWFRAGRISSQPRAKTKVAVAVIAAGLLGLVVLIVAFWDSPRLFPHRALLEAVRQNRVTQVQKLLREGADVNAKDKRGLPSLVLAAERGRLEMVKLLLDNGANVNARTKGSVAAPGGRTALMVASSRDHEEVARLLLDRGADVSVKDNEGRTAFMMAKLTIMKLLLERGAAVNDRNVNGSTALWSHCFAGGYESTKVARWLLEHGADVNIPDGRGLTPLMEAIQAILSGNDDLVNLILDYRPDVNAEDVQGLTALMIASSMGRSEVVKRLIERGADVNARNKEGRTALIRASDKGHHEIVKFLLENGADINVRDANGRTALTEASKSGYSQIIDLLKSHGARE